MFGLSTWVTGFVSSRDIRRFCVTRIRQPNFSINVLSLSSYYPLELEKLLELRLLLELEWLLDELLLELELLELKELLLKLMLELEELLLLLMLDELLLDMVKPLSAIVGLSAVGSIMSRFFIPSIRSNMV